MVSPVAILYNEGLKEYDFGPGHPFRGTRYHLFHQFLQERVNGENYQIIGAEPAGDEDLRLICTREYIEFTREYYRAAHLGLEYDGRFYQFHSVDNRPLGRPGKLEEAARLIIGQAKKAVELVEQGKFRKAVSLGGGLHHAKPSFGEGFCLYNDVAFTSIYLLERSNVKRILILDTDAHAGNGTAEYFYRDPRVLFIDLHQDPRTLYPGTGFTYQIGEEEGRGYTVNVPLPIDAGYESYKLVFEEIVQPLAQEFKPEIIVRNGGSDPHFNDQLTQLGLPIKGFRMIGEKVRALAELCQGKEIDLIASGYNERILPYAWLALIAGLAGIEVPVEEPEPIPERYMKDWAVHATEKVVREVKAELKEYWSCFR
ncbi:MAG: histone deacetylase [Methanophagales archaeon ANME-1-THS]|nr:MAG: histone deacetylase [Methanophagales archaeon ANME-1-THS]